MALLDHFAALRDPRQSWTVIYPLPEVLLVVVCGTLAGAQTLVEIAQWAEAKLDFLRRLRPFQRAIPSHDTLGDVLGALGGQAVFEVRHRLGGRVARGRAGGRGH